MARTSQNSQLKACLRNPQPQNSATFTYEICSLARKEVARVDHFVPEIPIAGLTYGRHFGQKGLMHVDVVVNDNLPLGRVGSVQSTRILRQGSAPRYGPVSYTHLTLPTNRE